MSWDKNICNIHGRLAVALSNIERSENREVEREKIVEAKAILSEAREAGKRMETRLAAYRKAFEALGFRPHRNGEIECGVIERKQNWRP